MTEGQREEFLDAFREQDTPTVGFCVMGGIFSEGIDLQNEAVIGVIIVGTGLPQTGSRQEILKSHYEKEGKNGFLFAYLYPYRLQLHREMCMMEKRQDNFHACYLLLP